MASNGSCKRRVACTCILLAAVAGCADGWYRDPRVPLAYDYPNVEGGGVAAAPAQLHGVPAGLGASPPHPVFFAVPLWPPTEGVRDGELPTPAREIIEFRNAPPPQEGPRLPNGSATR